LYSHIEKQISKRFKKGSIHPPLLNLGQTLILTVMHTSNGENGTKNSLILKDWSAIHHLLISSRKTIDEICSG